MTYIDTGRADSMREKHKKKDLSLQETITVMERSWMWKMGRLRWALMTDRWQRMLEDLDGVRPQRKLMVESDD